MGTNYENMGTVANRQYKDTIFRMLFQDKESLLSLYNAVNGTRYEDPKALEIVTLENAVYINMKNDQAFILDWHLSLYEHQSTINPNMPLRFLNYVAAEYRKLIKDFSLYSRKRIMLPNPNFIVFYNGTDDAPERDFMNLSDSFVWPENNPKLDLIVTQLNINPGFNEGIKEACQILREYMLYVELVRTFAKDMPLNQAVEKAVDYCITHDILADFLRKNRVEAIEVSIFEYNAEREMRLLREEIRADARAEGLEAGRAEGRAEGVELGIELFKSVNRMSREGKTMPEIAAELNISEDIVSKILKE